MSAEAGLKGLVPTHSETLLTWRIEALIAASDPDIRTRLAQIPHYRVLPAFKAGHLVLLPGPLLSSVSHHRIEAYELLARALHQERFR